MKRERRLKSQNEIIKRNDHQNPQCRRKKKVNRNHEEAYVQDKNDQNHECRG
jgi:hypothetical protein